MLLLKIHSAVASVAATPELELTQDEARQIATSYVAMQQHYGTVLSQKQIDTLAFFGVAGTIYGSRIVTLSKRKRPKPMPNTPDNIVPMPMSGGIPGF